MSNPVLVETLRGDLVENRHRGSIVVCDPRGRRVLAIGDADRLVYPRSAIKALQALPLVESGAADHYRLDASELALACSSHNAEPEHVNRVLGWLQRLDLHQDNLECGAHPPLHQPSADALLRAGDMAGRAHNNCSGKHAGMLCTARHLGEDPRGYIERDHPVQQRWFDALGDMAGVDMRVLPWNRDGCGIPVIAMPLAAIATAYARFAVPDELPAPRATALDRIATAIGGQPFMVAGSGRLCTEIMRLTGRRVLVKTGAAGVYTAALPEPGLGLALKIDDGLGDAAEVALLGALRRLGALHADEVDALAARCRVEITNTRGVITGYRQSAADLERAQ